MNKAPVPHSEEVPISILNHHQNGSDISHEAEFYSSDSDFEDNSSMVPQRFDQLELNDLIRDLDLSKESSEVLSSRLNKNFLHLGTQITYIIITEKYLYCHTSNDRSLVWCNDTRSLLRKMGVPDRI